MCSVLSRKHLKALRWETSASGIAKAQITAARRAEYSGYLQALKAHAKVAADSRK